MSDEQQPRYLTPGETLEGIPARGWNAFVDTWKQVKQRPGIHKLPPQGFARERLSVSVFYTTLIDADFPVLKLGDPAFTVDDRPEAIWDAITFLGATPDSDSTDGVVIMQGPVLGVGDCRQQGVLTGPSWATVDITDEAHTHAHPTSGENTKLTSGTSGWRMLWKQSGTGDKKAVVLLGIGGDGGTSGGAAIFGKLAPSVTGRAADVAGTGTLQCYVMDDSGNLTPESPDHFETVWNLDGRSSSGDGYLQAKKIGTHYFLDYETCGGS